MLSFLKIRPNYKTTTAIKSKYTYDFFSFRKIWIGKAKRGGIFYYILLSVRKFMREFAAAGGGGAKRQRPLFLILRSRQPVRQVSRERESLAQRGGGHRGHKAKKKKKRKRIKSPFQSSQTASDPPSGKGATSLSETRAPLVSHFIFCPVVFVFSFIL